MATIGWNESSPADTDNSGQGDDQIRSLKTSLRQGLDDEHVWPSAGGDAGVHRRGSAKVYYGAQSLVSSSGTDAKLMVTSDTSRLFHVGSGGSVLLGGWGSVSADSTTGVSWPQRAYWAIEFGSAYKSDDLQARVTYPNSGFSGVPYVAASLVTNLDQAATARLNVSIGLSQSTGFTWQLTNMGDTQTSGQINWISIGTRTL